MVLWDRIKLGAAVGAELTGRLPGAIVGSELTLGGALGAAQGADAGRGAQCTTWVLTDAGRHAGSGEVLNGHGQRTESGAGLRTDKETSWERLRVVFKVIC